MSDLFITHPIGKNIYLCISELSSDTLAEQGFRTTAIREGGLYLYKLDDRPKVGSLTVLARVPTLEAAFELLEVFKKLTKKKQKRIPKKRVKHNVSKRSGKVASGPKVRTRSEARI